MNHLINHHVHSTGSDGKLSPEQTIKLAIKKNLNFMCFTDHYPYPADVDDWGKDFHSEEYYKQIQKLIKKYKDKIEISFGGEFDWIETHSEYTKKEINKRKYDFILCSIHKIKIKNKYLTINNSEEIWNKILIEIKGVKNLIKEYYKQLRLAAKSRLFDCIAHFDLIKIYNENSKYFNENEKWYKEEVLKTLDSIKNNNLCIEINTSGIRRKCKEQYPSFWILKIANKMNIPITISSDSHYPEDIDKDLLHAINLAKKAGYSSIIKFKNRKPIKISI